MQITTSGSEITIKPYANADLTSQIGSDLVYTPVGVALTSYYGIIVSPSPTSQGYEIDEITIERIKNCIFDGLLNQDHDIEVFVMAQIEPLYRMEQRTKINRSSLKKAYENARVKLKNQLK